MFLLLALHASNSYCASETCERIFLSHATNLKNTFLLLVLFFRIKAHFETGLQWFDVRLNNCHCLEFNFNEVNTTETCEPNDANTKLVPEAKEGEN